MHLKPDNFSDPRKIAFATQHLLLIVQIQCRCGFFYFRV